LPFKPAIAFSASPLSGISTNPKPRERPVARSVTTVTPSTLPKGSKSDRSSASVTLKEKLPTKIFFMLFLNSFDGLFSAEIGRRHKQ
jgi:hypothetical protein